MTNQPLPRRGIQSASVLVIVTFLLLPVSVHSQTSESFSEGDLENAIKSMLSGPCGKYFGIDSCSTDSFDGIVTDVSVPELTIQLASNARTLRVRLAGVNVPAELADDVNQLLSSQLLNKPVNIIIFCKGQLPKGQLVGRVRGDGKEVNIELIRQGFAYFDGSGEGLNSYDRCTYSQAQEDAEAERRGLWSKETGVAPSGSAGIARSRRVPPSVAPPGPAPGGCARPGSGRPGPPATPTPR
jgi:Staphylococcal nuclease homologue